MFVSDEYFEQPMDFLVAPESERLRKRNMALWEVVSSESSYVDQLKDLETVSPAPEGKILLTASRTDVAASAQEHVPLVHQRGGDKFPVL